ncbi:MAG: hypothetical protein P8Y23_04860 [Candidatus Lokiarchaeota archaeon]
MVLTKELKNILDILGNEAKTNGLTSNFNSHIFFETLNKDDISFSKFKSIIISDWEDFREKNQKRIIKKSYTTFFYQKFNKYFVNYINEFCGFHQEQLELINREKISDDNLFFEYKYYLSNEEIMQFNAFSNNFEDKLNGITSPFGYLYLIISILGVVIRNLIQEKLYIILDGAVMSNRKNGKTISLFIIIKNSKDETFQKNYIN